MVISKVYKHKFHNLIKVTCLVICYEDQNNYGITKPIII
jgi:hypothetical protein